MTPLRWVRLAVLAAAVAACASPQDGPAPVREQRVPAPETDIPPGQAVAPARRSDAPARQQAAGAQGKTDPGPGTERFELIDEYRRCVKDAEGERAELRACDSRLKAMW